MISIHALLAESDHAPSRSPCSRNNFYPRSPCGERREPTALRTPHHRFLSTLSLRRATALGLLGWLRVLISIHALLAESDGIFTAFCVDYPKFLSTLSLRRATASQGADFGDKINFYPRSPCGERQCLGLLGWLRVLISIHALLAESDVTVLGIQHKVGISIHALLAESDAAGVFCVILII